MTDLVQKIADGISAALREWGADDSDFRDSKEVEIEAIRHALADAGGAVALDYYDAGLLGDGGGGDVDWWQDYMRAELARAHEFYQSQVDGMTIPADGRVAELEIENIALTCNQDGLLEALEGLLSVVSVRIDDPRIKQFDAARHAVALVKGNVK